MGQTLLQDRDFDLALLEKPGLRGADVRFVVGFLELNVLQPLDALGPALDPAQTGRVLWIFRDDEEAAFRLSDDGVVRGLKEFEELLHFLLGDPDLHGQDHALGERGCQRDD